MPGVRPCWGSSAGIEDVMAIIWTVSHPERLVVAVGRNSVTATDILFCVDGMLKAGVISYRKIYDMTLSESRCQSWISDRSECVWRPWRTARGSGPWLSLSRRTASLDLPGTSKRHRLRGGRSRSFAAFYAARVWLDEIVPPDLVSEVAQGQRDASQPTAIVENISRALTAKNKLPPRPSTVVGEVE